MIEASTIETIAAFTPIPPKLLAAIEVCATRCGVSISVVDREGTIVWPPTRERDARPPYLPDLNVVVNGALEAGPGVITLVADVWASVIPLGLARKPDGFLVAFTVSRSAGAACALNDILQLLDQTVSLHAQAVRVQSSATGLR